MGNFLSFFCCWSEPEPESVSINIEDNFYLTSTGGTYYYALSHENYCKLCERPKNLTKGTLFCNECKEKYGLS